MTGSSTSNRVRTTLTLSVEDIEYDTSACQLRVKGRNIQENQYVKVSIKKPHPTCMCMYVVLFTHKKKVFVRLKELILSWLFYFFDSIFEDGGISHD